MLYDISEVNKMKIALWGAGEFAKYVVASLSSNNEIDIVCSIDNYKKRKYCRDKCC